MIKLNLGAGNDIQEGYINHDLRKHRPEIDITWDLNEKNWRKILEPEILFESEIEKGWMLKFDEIRAWDVIEHLNDPINFMDNCWDLLHDRGAILNLKACGWQNPNFNVDITHKNHGFDIKSFDYFDPDTELGKEYGYYTDKKWKILEKKYDKRKNVLIRLVPRK